MEEQLIPYGADPDAVAVADPEDLDTVGFHPSWRRPFPSIQCRGTIRSGERAGEQCQKRASLGGYLCIKHGGQLPNNKKLAASIVAAARMQLQGGTELAVDTLLDLAKNANSEAVKLGAANSILDRAGVKGGQDLNVTVTQGESPHDVLADRLSKLRDRVIDGETVDTVDSEPVHPDKE